MRRINDEKYDISPSTLTIEFEQCFQTSMDNGPDPQVMAMKRYPTSRSLRDIAEPLAYGSANCSWDSLASRSFILSESPNALQGEQFEVD